MSKIKTAEEILEELEDPIWAMKEYAKQFIDLAAERAFIGPLGVSRDIRLEVDKKSILKIKELIK